MAHTAKSYAKVPTLFDRVPDELSAIEAITRVLGSLPDHETRLRVINWINERFSQGLQAAPPEPRPSSVASAMPSPDAADSGLRIPDDLFEPLVVTSESPDLHGVFDLPAVKRHALATRPPERAFELVPSKETPAQADLAGAAADEPVRMADRRQRNLLLLADMSTPAVLKVSDAPPRNPEPAQDSMEAMLRSLVDDFRQLADDWGNT
jgi:hypothetical protein